MHTEEKYNDIDKLIASYLSNELDEKSFSELKRWSMDQKLIVFMYVISWKFRFSWRIER